MNIFKKLYCRTYQGIMRGLLPFLPYREPKILKTNDEVSNILLTNRINNVLLVTDSGLSQLKLYAPLLENLNKKGISVAIYDKTVPNPTTDNVAEAVSIYKQNKNRIQSKGELV